MVFSWLRPMGPPTYFARRELQRKVGYDIQGMLKAENTMDLWGCGEATMGQDWTG